MNKNVIRDAIIFSAIFTILSAIIKMLFKPDAKVINEDAQTESNLRISGKGCVVTGKDDGLEAAKIFFYAMYTILNVIHTIRILKKDK